MTSTLGQDSTDVRLKRSANSIKAIGAVAVGAFVVILAVYGLWFSVLLGYRLSPTTSDWGTFGDFVGGLANPLVGLATLVIVALAYLAQRQELEETIAALAHSASEQARIAAISILQGQIQVKAALLNSKVETMGGLHNEIQRLASVDQIQGQQRSVLSFRGKQLTSERERQAEIREILPTVDKVDLELHELKVDLEKLASELSCLGG